MIHNIYAQKILAALFHTSLGAIPTKEEEEQQLNAKNIPKEVTAQAYCNAFVANDYVDGGDTIERYNAWKNEIDNCAWFYTETVAKAIKYTDKNGNEKSEFFYGWERKENSLPSTNYPSKAFLALFTKMPDENGDGYEEPDKESTTYMRVNLNESIITGGKSLNNAVKNTTNGEATLTNKEIIMYPEVYGIDWGTIVGFGVFQEEEAMTGTPIFWGRLNEQVTTTINHVPLFRVGDFQVTLS